MSSNYTRCEKKRIRERKGKWRSNRKSKWERERDGKSKWDRGERDINDERGEVKGRIRDQKINYHITFVL